MLALRRASLPLRSRGLSIRVSSAVCAETEQPITQTQDQTIRCLSFPVSYRYKHASSNNFLVSRGLASHTRASGEDGDLSDGFSELDAEDGVAKVGSGTESEDEPISEPEFSEDDEADLMTGEKVPPKKRRESGLLKAIIAAPGSSVPDALNKWVEEGNTIDTEEISFVIFTLRKIRMYGRALQFSEWLETSKTIELSEKDCSSRLDLICKLHGVAKAERYIDRIPIPLRGGLVYGALLAGCVRTLNIKKSEEIFEKIKNEFTVTDFACNQMIFLYRKMNNKKIADVLLLMEKNSINPSRFTYRMLVDIKGQHGDITGMEQILETMRSEGVEPDTYTKFTVARHYSWSGHKDKAEAMIKEIEGDNLEDNRKACQTVIRLYGELGRADEVERVWKVCEASPWGRECLAAIEAWGGLKRVEKAEAVFEKMLTVVNKPRALHYNALLKVYSTNKMLAKGKELIKQMADKGLPIGPVTWDSLVRLYVEAGELNSADSVLHKATQHNSVVRPLFVSYMAVMDEYAKRGDTHNTEKMFQRMKEAKYQPKLRQFQTLVKAYVVSKAPLYGIRERMKANNVYPTKALSEQMELLDPFRKTAVSDLLD